MNKYYRDAISLTDDAFRRVLGVLLPHELQLLSVKAVTPIRRADDVFRRFVGRVLFMNLNSSRLWP